MSSDEKFLSKKQIAKLDRELHRIINRVGVDRKTLDEVFDKSTLHSIEKLISNRIIDYLDFPISTGKEGNVFLGITPKKTPVAVKIYRIATSNFKHMSQYILGDPRFKNFHKTRRDIIYTWTSKEFKNLELLESIGVPVPKPIIKYNNILVMEYIGSEEQPAPLMKDIILSNPEKTFQILIDSISKMYHNANLVHADLSPFNILIYDNKPYIIDVGQAVLLDHPSAHEFLKRDIYNIVSYFRRYDIKEDWEDIYRRITSGGDEK